MQAKLTTTTVKTLNPIAKPFEVVDTEIKGFLLRVQPSGRKTFYFTYRNNARKRQRIKIGVLGPTMSAQQARDKAVVYAGQVADGADVQRARALDKQKAIEAEQKNLGRFIDDHYRAWITVHHKTGQMTLDRLIYSFKEFMSWPLYDITVPVMEKWRIEKVREGNKPNSVNRVVFALRGLMRCAVEWGVLDEHPLKKLKPLINNSTPIVRYLSSEDEQRLFAVLQKRDAQRKQERDALNQHRRERGLKELPHLSTLAYADRMIPAVILSLKSGLRRSELFSLEWVDVNFVTKVLTVRAEIAKSSKVRHVPLSPLALEALQQWQEQAPQPKGLVFPAHHGGIIRHTDTDWPKIVKQAELGKFRWHDMRHDFASQLVMKGVPLNTVRELCGHSDFHTTLRYAHLAPDHKADAIALLG